MRLLLHYPSPWRRLLLSLAVALPLLTACSSGGSNDAVDAANSQNASKISEADVTEKQEADAQFLVKATSNALLGVELGKLAQARGTVPAVRAYGARLVQNRLGLLSALRSLASAKQLAIPNALGEDEQEAYHEASTQSGSQLDKRAMSLIVKIQKQDADAFDDMKDDAYDGDIRGFAAKYEPSVEEEMSAAEEVADAVDDLP